MGADRNRMQQNGMEQAKHNREQRTEQNKHTHWSIVITQNDVDDVTCDVVPGSMRTHRSNIHCYFARQYAHASRWSGNVLLKLPPH